VTERSDIQLLGFVPLDPPVVAGIPAILRTAHSLAGSRIVGRVFLGGQSSTFVRQWRARLPAVPWETIAYDNGSGSVAEQLDPLAPVVVLAGHGMPDVPSLERFLGGCDGDSRPRTWTLDGAVLAAYYPRARDLPPMLAGESREIFQQLADDRSASAIPAGPDAWRDLTDAEGTRRAETQLYQSLRKDSDGYLARLDRSVSIALSRRLVRTPVTPNILTGLSLILGILGAALLTSPAYLVALLGTALLWGSCILDGCDGEVARLKLMTTPGGARFDEMVDNIVHVATFVAILLHVHRLHPGFDMRTPGILLIAGVILSMVAVWRLILRRPGEGRARFEKILERLASRDYVYLVVVLTAVQRLEWFVWSAAIGVHLFWFTVWWGSGRARPA
jgi:phosphatidylglycerophosphate synthase